MLEQIVSNIEKKRKSNKDLDYFILDDGSDPPINDYHKMAQNTTNYGKKGFWRLYKLAFEIALKSAHEDFIFMPDDWLRLNINSLQALANKWQGLAYSLNIVNDGRNNCWGNYRTGVAPIKYDGRYITEIGFNDCGFMSNRSVIELLEIKPILNDWFDRPDKSSGVGYQLTKQMRRLNIPMLKPNKSFAFHGEHESKMHKELRKKEILKSI
jgi:hypothetical protein